MNRDHLNLCTFDPLPMALGERTTRQPAPAVNPRAEFEAFERGDHVVPGEMIPLMRKRTPTFNEVRVERIAKEIAEKVGLPWPCAGTLVMWGDKPFQATAPKVDHEPTFNDVLEAARRHKDKFGTEATKELMFLNFGARRLHNVPRERYAQAIAVLKSELGPEPVNPRAEFEAFQQHMLKLIAKSMGTSLRPIAPQEQRQQVYNRLVDVARNHRLVFGTEATKALMLDKFGATRLLNIPDDRRLEAIAVFRSELNAKGYMAGPEPDDGEGDTPDIAR